MEKVLTLKEIVYHQQVLYGEEFLKFLTKKRKRGKRKRGKRKLKLIPAQVKDIPMIKINPLLRKEERGKYYNHNVRVRLSYEDRCYTLWNWND